MDPEDDRQRRKQQDSKVLFGKEGSFALLEVIGKGAYGTVYKGLWREVGKYVAIKRVLRQRLTDGEKKSLQGEIYLFKKLKHEHIVTYIEAVEDDKSDYFDIVMEYVEGGSLFKMVDLIRKSHTSHDDSNQLTFDETLIANFIKQILLGLQYLHYQGITHRDIKGANLLITKDRHIKLTDFGVSSFSLNNKQEGSQQQHDVDIAGTPYWMAPEIITLTGSSTASDIWSLGCTLIELLTGAPPYHQFEGFTAMFRIVSDDCPPLPSNISAECEDFLRKCFNKDVQARATADELLLHKWITANEQETQLEGANFNDEFSTSNVTSATPNDNKYKASSTSIALDQYEEDDDDFDDADFEVSQSDKSEADTSLSNIDDVGIDIHHANNSTLNMPSFSTSPLPQHENVAPSDDSLALSKGMKSTSLRDDPFQDLMDDPDVDNERERLRKEKNVWKSVKEQVSALGKEEDMHLKSCDVLIDIFKRYPEQRYNLIYELGLRPIKEILKNNDHYNVKILESMLKVILSLVETDELALMNGEGNANPFTPLKSLTGSNYLNKSDIREDLSDAGILPVVMEYCNSKYPFNLRLLSCKFIRKMIDSSDKILHGFLQFESFSIFVDLLENDILRYNELCNLSIFGIYKLFAMNNHKHKRNLCREFVCEGLLDKIIENLSQSLNQIDSHLNDVDNMIDLKTLENNIIELTDLLKIFAARSDSVVKLKMVNDNVLQVMNEILLNKNKHMLKEAIQSILCGIRDLTRDAQTHDSLENCGIINTLVVEYLIDNSNNNTDIMNNMNVKHFIISSLHNLCNVFAVRQERIVLLGIAPYLQKIILSKDIIMQPLCIDLYSGLARSSHLARTELSKDNGIEFYIELMIILCERGTVRKWQVKVLESIYEWLEDRQLQSYVESRISLKDNKQKFCRALIQAQLHEIEHILDPYLKIVRKSSVANQIFGCHHELIVVMVRWLDAMYNHSKHNLNSSSTRGRLLLLMTLLEHARQWKPTTLPRGIISGLRVLLTDMTLDLEEVITVREQATTLLTVIDGFKL